MDRSWKSARRVSVHCGVSRSPAHAGANRPTARAAISQPSTTALTDTRPMASLLPVDLALVAAVDRPDVGEDFPDLLVAHGLADGLRHRRSGDLALDELEERLIAAAEFPRGAAVLDQRGSHPAPSA